MVTQGGGGFGEAGDIFPVAPTLPPPISGGGFGEAGDIAPRPRPPRRTVTPTPITTLTADDILELLRLGPDRGGISPEDAIAQLAAIFQRQGTNATAARQNAEQFVQEAQQGNEALQAQLASAGEQHRVAAIEAGDIAGGGIGEFPPFSESEFADPEQRARQLSETFGGRRTLFNEFASTFLPEVSPQFARTGLERRFSPLQSSFFLRSALGQLPTGPEGGGQTFTDFIQNALGQGGVGTRSGLQERLLELQNLGGFERGQVPDSGFSAFQQQLETTPELAFQTALSAGGLPFGSPLRGAFEDVAGRRFQRFIAQNPVGAGSRFLEQFTGRGFQF